MTDIEKRYFSVIGNLPTGWTFKRNDSLYEERKEFCDESESVNNLLSVSEYYGVAKRSEKVEDGDIVSRAETLDGYRRCFKNDFVMNYMLAWKGAQATSELDGVVSPSYAVFKPRGGILPRYANYLFRTKLYCGLFEVNSTGIIKSRLRLYPKAFLKINAIVPPLLEQQSIIDYLDKKCSTIDEAIARHKQIIEKLEEYRSIQISSMATKGINPDSPLRVSGTDWYGKIPKNWEIKRFKYVAEVKSNLVDPRPYMALNQIGPDLIEKNSGRLVGSRTVEEAGVISGNHLFHAGQILYSKVRPALNKVVIAPFDGLCSADMYPIETSMDAEYLKYLMLSKPFAEQVRIIAMIRVKMPKINQDELGDVLCVVPPMDQQKEIASSITEMCNQIEAVISRHNEIIEKLEEYRKSIIYNAVTGKIDCREVV